MTGQPRQQLAPPAPPVDWGPRGTAGVSFAADLRFEDVDVYLGGRKVLDKLNLHLNPGEIVCLLGESGSGKSTILRAAAGIQAIDAGTISINDVVMSGPGVDVPPEKRGVGLMFQDFALFPHMTLLENAAFGLAPLGKRAAREQARNALRRVGLLDRADDYPHQLSGGQQQRLALARTVAPRPGVLLLDEPFSSLDARLRESVRSETLAVLRETHATSLIVTHDPEEAMILGDRVALLRNGRIVQIDTAERLYRAPVDLEAARFLSFVSETRAIVAHGHIQTPFGDVPTPDYADGTRVVAALRPIGALQYAFEPPGTLGRIVSKRTAIGFDLCEVQVAGMDDPVRIRRPANAALVAGMDVFVRLNPQDVLVFAED